MQMKIIKDFSILLVSVVLFCGVSHVVFADTQTTTDTNAAATTTVSADTDVSTSDLDVSNPGLLPTSPFYFLKEWGRGLRMLVTFNDTAKTQLQLDIANQKAAEVVAVQQQNPDDQSAIQKALANYTDSQEKLKEKLGSLQGNSGDSRIATLIANIDARLQKHEQVFEKLAAKDSALAQNIQEKKNEIESILSEATDKDKDGKTKAQDALDAATKAMTDLQAAVTDATTKGLIKTTTAGSDEDTSKGVAKRMENLNARLTKAKTAFDNAKYGATFGLAVSVRVEAEAMLMHIKRLIMMQQNGKLMPKNGVKPGDMMGRKDGRDGNIQGAVCPQLAPACGTAVTDCLKAALALNQAHPGCQYGEMCRQCNYATAPGGDDSQNPTEVNDHQEVNDNSGSGN